MIRASLCMAFFLMIALAGNAQDWVSWYEQGSAQYKAGNYLEAIRLFTKSIEIKPTGHNYTGRGLAKEDSGDLEGAIRDFNQAHALDPSLILAIQDRAVAYSKLGRNEESIADFDWVLSKEPENLVVHLSRSAVLYKLSRYREALDEIAYAESRGFALPADVWYVRSLSYAGLQEHDNAAKAMETAAIVYSDSVDKAEAWNVCATLRKKIQDYPGALNAFQRATAFDPHNAGYWKEWGMLEKNEGGNLPHAIEVYASWAENIPDDPAPWLEIGWIRMGQLQYDQAVTDINRCIDLDPGYRDAYNLLGLALLGKGQLSEALNAFLMEAGRQDDKGLITTPLLDGNDTEKKLMRHCIRAQAYYQFDSLDQAKIQLDSALKIKNDFPYIYELKTYLLQSEKKYADALKVSDQLIRILIAEKQTPGEMMVAWHTHGELLMQVNRCREAIADFDKVLAADPSMDPSLRARARCHFKLGDYARAIADLDKALASPWDVSVKPELLYYRGISRIRTGKKTEGCEDLRQSESGGWPDARMEILKSCK